MKEEDVKKVVFRLLKKIAPDTEPSALQPNDVIGKTLQIDSFDYLQLMVGLDAELGVQIPEEDYGKVQRLQDLIAYLVKKITAK